MEFMRRNDRVTGGRGEGADMSKEERRAKWSDGVAGRLETVVGMERLMGVINRSRVLPFV